MSYYPYGSVPSQGYTQPGVQVNPVGYSAPVSNPFHQIIASHGISKMISGMAGSSSYSSSSDATIVTYDSYMKDKEFSKTVLGMTEQDIKDHGAPFGLKYNDCEVVIPLPSKRTVCQTINNQITDLMKDTGRSLTDKEKKEVMQKISEGLATEFYAQQCGLDCNPFQPGDSTVASGSRPSSIASGVRDSIHRATGLFP